MIDSDFIIVVGNFNKYVSLDSDFFSEIHGGYGLIPRN